MVGVSPAAASGPARAGHHAAQDGADGTATWLLWFVASRCCCMRLRRDSGLRPSLEMRLRSGAVAGRAARGRKTPGQKWDGRGIESRVSVVLGEKLCNSRS